MARPLSYAARLDRPRQQGRFVAMHKQFWHLPPLTLDKNTPVP